MSNYRYGFLSRIWIIMGSLVVVGVFMGCGESEVSETAEEPAMEESAPIAEPRVFFVAPKDDTDHPTELPLVFEFGSENFEISPVPAEFEVARPDVGHYHLGVGAECLPVDEITPQGDPWIHFGDGSNTIEIPLEGGEYRFSVQIGDDDHRTMQGLCETITVRMEDGI